jgi:hypothetical protein
MLDFVYVVMDTDGDIHAVCTTEENAKKFIPYAQWDCAMAGCMFTRVKIKKIKVKDRPSGPGYNGYLEWLKRTGNKE